MVISDKGLSRSHDVVFPAERFPEIAPPKPQMEINVWFPPLAPLAVIGL